MTKKVLIADLKDFCSQSIEHFLSLRCVTPPMTFYYDYLKGRIESLQMVLDKLEDYD